MATRYCENCGSPLGEESRFCENCGADSASAPPAPPLDPAPAPNNPIPSPSRPDRRLAYGLGLAVLLALVGFGAWQFVGNKGAGQANPKDTTSASAGKNAADVTKKAAPDGAKTGVADGEAFIGKWFHKGESSADSESVVLTFSRQGSLIVGAIAAGSEGRLELVPAPGNKLSGEGVAGDGERIPVTAELLSDGQRMVLTYLPPASEPATAIFWRVKDEDAGPGPSAGGASGPIDKQKATEIVSRLPDVEAFSNRLKAVGKSAKFETTEEDPNTWMVRVFEIVEDEGVPHTATFGWFKVDKTTGKVSPGME